MFDISPIIIPDERTSVAQRLTYIAAERMRRDLRLFAQRAWSQIIPQTPIWNWHMSCICDHLSYVTQGDIRFLMISLPPRHGKSLLCSVMWPAWHWLHNAGTQFITASVDDKLARRDSILSRRLIESPWFQSMYGKQFYLLPDENKADMFRNNAGGYRLMTSVQGRATGDGGDIQCFPAGTLVHTENGPMPIEALEFECLMIRSFDGASTRFKRQIGFHKSAAAAIRTITTAGGEVIECTPEHRVYVVGRGWVEARNISIGDTLYAERQSNLRPMQEGVLSAASARGTRGHGAILLSPMFLGSAERGQQSIWQVFRRKLSAMLGMRKPDSRKAVCWKKEWTINLLACLQVCATKAAIKFAGRDPLRGMSEDHGGGVGTQTSQQTLQSAMRTFSASC